MAEPKFEKDLERLEEIVEALEGGGLALDEALKTFEEGIKLAKRCEKALVQAEKRIETLTANEEGELEAEPFDAEKAEEPPAKKSKRGSRKPAKEDEPDPVEPPEPMDEDGNELF